jgi:hypothetical protein
MGSTKAYSFWMDDEINLKKIQIKRPFQNFRGDIIKFLKKEEVEDDVRLGH